MKMWKKIALAALMAALLLAAVGAEAINQLDNFEDYQPPTCTKPGYYRLYGDNNRTTIPAQGHDWGAWKVTKKATCGDTGTRTRICTRDNCKAKETEAIKPLGHNWGAWKVTKEATCGDTGTRTRTCTRCNISQKQTIAATGKHKLGPAKITKQATESSYGIKTATCSVCGKKVDTRYYLTGTVTSASKNKDQEIMDAQQEMKESGIYNGEVNGRYDKATENAVKEFQRRAGVEQSGILYPDTKERLDWYWQKKTGKTELIVRGKKRPFKNLYADWTSNGDGTHSRYVFRWNKTPSKIVETEDCDYSERMNDHGLFRYLCPKCGAEESDLHLWSVQLGQPVSEEPHKYIADQVYGAVRYTGASGSEAIGATLYKIEANGEQKVYETADMGVYAQFPIDGPGTYVLEAWITDGEKTVEPMRSAPLLVRKESWFTHDLEIYEVTLSQTAATPEGDITVDLMSSVGYSGGRGPVELSAVLYEVRDGEERMCYYMPQLLPVDTLRTYPAFGDAIETPTAFVLEVTGTDGFTVATARSNVLAYNGPMEDGNLVSMATLTLNGPEKRDESDMLDYSNLFTCTVTLEDGLQAVSLSGTLNRISGGHVFPVNSYMTLAAGDNSVCTMTTYDGPGDYYVDVDAFDGEKHQLVRTNTVHVAAEDLRPLSVHPCLVVSDGDIFSYYWIEGGQTGDAWATAHSVTRIAPDGTQQTAQVPVDTWLSEPLPFSGPGVYVAVCTATDGVSTVTGESDPLIIPDTPQTGKVIQEVRFFESDHSGAMLTASASSGPRALAEVRVMVRLTDEYKDRAGEIAYQCELISTAGEILKTYPGLPADISLTLDGKGTGSYMMRVTAFIDDVVDTVCSPVLNMYAEDFPPLQIISASLYADEQLMLDVQWMGGWGLPEEVKGEIRVTQTVGKTTKTIYIVPVENAMDQNIWAFDLMGPGSYQATVTLKGFLATETAKSNAVVIKDGEPAPLMVKNVYLTWNDESQTAKASFELVGPKEKTENAKVTGQILRVVAGHEPTATDIGAYGPAWDALQIGGEGGAYVLEVIAEYTAPDGTVETAYGFSLIPMEDMLSNG